MIEIIAPEKVGMSSKRLKDIETTMQTFVDQSKLAGISTLIARRGKVVHFGCYGKLDLAANKPLQPDSLFRIYSLTKPITSVAALMLYEEGYFDLDEPVTRWIPEFKHFRVLPQSTSSSKDFGMLEKEITFRHLLTHTAGLGYGFNTEPIEELYREAQIMSVNPIPALNGSLTELIEKVVKLPLTAQPGTTWHYSVAHDVVGYLIGIISGKPFDAFLRERVLQPLGMQDTSFNVPQEKLERFGPLYSAPGEDGGLSVLDDVATSRFVTTTVIPYGGGGLVSSMPDYFRFLLMLANGGELGGIRLLKQDTVTAMTTNQLYGSTFPVRFNNEPWPGMGYGLGIGVQVIDPIHIGWIGLSGTSAWIFPREDLIVMAMPQAAGYSEASDVLLKMAHDTIII